MSRKKNVFRRTSTEDRPRLAEVFLRYRICSASLKLINSIIFEKKSSPDGSGKLFSIAGLDHSTCKQLSVCTTRHVVGLRRGYML